MKVHFSPAEPATHWSKAFSNIRSNSGQSWAGEGRRQAVRHAGLGRWGDWLRYRRLKGMKLTLLESIPLTCRSCSIVHCDLLTKADDPWNCLTLVMDTWDGFLFVTAKERNNTWVLNNFSRHLNQSFVICAIFAVSSRTSEENQPHLPGGMALKIWEGWNVRSGGAFGKRTPQRGGMFSQSI